MQVLSKDKSGKGLTVEVAVGQAGWKFPPDHLTRTAEKTGKEYFVIPVKYSILDEMDTSRTLADIIAHLRTVGIEDPIAEMNAGLKLAQGDLVKKPYRAEAASPAAKAAAALKWMIVEASPEVRNEYIRMAGLGDDSRAAAYALTAYEESLTNI